MKGDLQLDLFRGQPDEEAIKLLQGYESFALSIDPRGYCVCTSEGKDSRVLGHLMRRAGVKHFYIHNVTGIDPPELIYFQRRNFSEYMAAGYECHDIMYEMSLWQLMIKKGIPPLRQKRYCCQHLKERRTPEQGKAMISTGVRRAESSRRAKMRSELEWRETFKAQAVHVDPDTGRDRWAGEEGKSYLRPYDQDDEVTAFETCYNNPDWGANGLWTINPIAEWPDHWIWDYSKEAGLEQCSLYDEGFHRLGCIGCPMARCEGRKKEFERWPGFKKLYIQTLNKMIEIREQRGMVQLFKGKNPGEEWFEWWMSDEAHEKPIDDSQIGIEEFKDNFS